MNQEKKVKQVLQVVTSFGHISGLFRAEKQDVILGNQRVTGRCMMICDDLLFDLSYVQSRESPGKWRLNKVGDRLRFGRFTFPLVFSRRPAVRTFQYIKPQNNGAWNVNVTPSKNLR